jgi:hypothetical protein
MTTLLSRLTCKDCGAQLAKKYGKSKPSERCRSCASKIPRDRHHKPKPEPVAYSSYCPDGQPHHTLLDTANIGHCKNCGEYTWTPERRRIMLDAHFNDHNPTLGDNHQGDP